MSESKLREAARALAEILASERLTRKAHDAMDAVLTALDAAPEVGEPVALRPLLDKAYDAHRRDAAVGTTLPPEVRQRMSVDRIMAEASLDGVFDATDENYLVVVPLYARPTPPPADDAVARAREAFTVAARAHCRAQVALEQRPFSNFLDTETRAAQSEVVRRNVDQMAAYDALLAAEKGAAS